MKLALETHRLLRATAAILSITAIATFTVPAESIETVSTGMSLSQSTHVIGDAPLGMTN